MGGLLSLEDGLELFVESLMEFLFLLSLLGSLGSFFGLVGDVISILIFFGSLSLRSELNMFRSVGGVGWRLRKRGSGEVGGGLLQDGL